MRARTADGCGGEAKNRGGFTLLSAVGLLLSAVLGCASPGRVPEPAPVARVTAPAAAPVERVAAVSAEESDFTILAVNDVYRIEGVDAGTAGGLARLRTLREELETGGQPVLVLHAGDLLFPSLLSHTYLGEQMIDVLNALDGARGGHDVMMFAVFGNHEFDKDELSDAAMLDRRVEESEFVWLETNVEFADGDDGRPLVDAWNLGETALVLVETGGVEVGIFGLTTDMKHPAYVASFGDPVETARRATEELRAEGADVVVALTHLEMSEDLAMLTALGAAGPDLVVGGHEHNAQCQPLPEEDCRVFKADAEARTASVFDVAVGPVGTGGSRTVRFDHRLVELDASVEEDPAVASLVDDWLVRHDREYCTETLGQPPGCLAEPLGTTRTRLLGEELEIRRYETNLGNWVADRALAAYRPHGAQAAVVNAGSLRLNQDVPAGADVTRRHVEELFPYPAGLVLLRLDGATLQEVVSRAVEGWTGNGWWLQVAGLAFRHEPETGTASGLTLLAPGGPRPVAPDEELLVVVPDYLAQGNDGYPMLAGAPRVDAPAADLKQLVADALRAAGEEGIAPEVEGRICNTERPGPCLAMP